MVVAEAFMLYPANYGDLVDGIRNVSWYVSNIPYNNSGPYVGGPCPFHQAPITQAVSPLLEACQSTYLVIMSSGEPIVSPGSLHRDIIIEYMHDHQCSLLATDPERCGRELVSWMATTNHSNFEGGNNFIKTYTIGVRADKESVGQKFLNDLAEMGGGKAYRANDATELLAAFSDVVNEALTVNVFSTGRVAMNQQNGRQQRKEVFYTLYETESYDYWSGNVKGFMMKYIDTELANGSIGKRAILYDKTGTQEAMGADGFFRSGISSFWSSSDSESVSVGGTLGQLASPMSRSIFTQRGGANIDLKASSVGLTNESLNVESDDKREGLLDFIRGYQYQEGGSDIKGKNKIGDSARSGASLVSYGCNKAGYNAINCPFDELSQVAIVASNDGIIRGYDTLSGKTLYEYMPIELLPIIKKLQAREGVSATKIRTYGLDGNVTIYHDDINKNGFVDNGEKAYAYVASGRGGSYIYGLDITNKSNPKLLWTITADKPGFSKLGYTWSTPVAGNVIVDGVRKGVILFGGGYDTSIDDNPQRHTNTKGNVLYMVDIVTGSIIWSTSANMSYSIPSPVALVNNDSGLITDIFVGDVGGQLWRFMVTNGNSAGQLVKAGGGDNGVVARVATSALSESRKIYYAPMIYRFKSGQYRGMLSVSVGTGYQAHPLSTSIQDAIYSFRFPARFASNRVVTPDMLAVYAADGQSVTKPKNLYNGFMVNLTGLGEKVVSNGVADFNRLVVNTYVPDKLFKRNCTPSNGQVRSYYIDLITGISMLDTAYVESNVVGLPSDVITYCGEGYCTIVSDSRQLSSETDPLGKDDLDANIIRYGDLWKKQSWVDLFSPEAAAKE